MNLEPAHTRWRLSTAYFLHSFVVGMWSVAYPVLLKAFGLPWLVAYTGILASLSLFSAPWIGSLADQRLAAQKLFGYLCVGAALFLALSFYLLSIEASASWVMLSLFAHYLCYSPTWALLSSISFANLRDKDAFPQVRVFGTYGWMSAGWFTSYVLAGDEQVSTGYFAAGLLMLVAVLARHLPHTPPLGRPSSTWQSRFGLEALRLFKEPDQRVFFVATGFIAVPIAAFYPYSSRLLESMGQSKVSGLMTFGQILEIIAMLTLSRIIRKYRIKAILLVAFVAAFWRYAFYLTGAGTGILAWVLLGVSMHGIAYTLHMITGQIFIERRVEPEIRGQAQALLTTVNALGALIGYALIGQWFLYCIENPQGPGWVVFWGVLALWILAVIGYFAKNYRGVAVAEPVGD